MDALLAELERASWLRRHRVAVGAAVLAVGAAASFTVIAATRSRRPPAMVVASARNLTTDPGCEEYPSFTPDGREVVFDGVVDDDIELEAVAVDTGARRRLTHAPGWDLGAAVSPDGRHVAYVHDARELRVVAIEGDAAAPPRTVGVIRGFPGWTRDGDILYGDPDGRILRAPIHGVPTPIARLPPGELPMFIDEFPDGEIVLSLRTPDQRSNMVAMAHVRPGGVAERYEPRWETTDTSAIRVDREGRGVYYVAPTPSGLPKLHWRPRGGEPIVLDGTRAVTNSFAVASAAGRLAFSQCEPRPRVGRMTRRGFEPLASMGADWGPSLLAAMPDDHLIVSAQRSADSQLHLWKVSATGVEQVTSTAADQPAVSADGLQLAWAGVAPEHGIYVRATAGGSVRRLTTDGDDGSPLFSHDGANVLFTRGGRVYSFPVAAESAVPVTPTGVVGFSVAPDRALLAVVFEEHERRVIRIGPEGGPFDEIPGLAERKYDEVVFDGANLLLATATSLYERHGDGSERELWSSTIDTLAQVAASRTVGEPWAIVTGYEGDLALVEGEFP
jgi:hypothetical protein